MNPRTRVAHEIIAANEEIIKELQNLRAFVGERLSVYEASSAYQQRIIDVDAAQQEREADQPTSYVERAEDAGYDPWDPKAIGMDMRGEL